MDCPACRASNTSGLKYCVRCGRNLESSQEVNYENIGMNGYHTQEEYSQNRNEFENMFAINDKNTAYISSEMFMSEERSQFGETDFRGRDEPLVSQPYKDSLSGRADDMKSNYINQSVEKEFDFGGRDEPLVSQPYKDSLSGRAEDMKSNYINQSVEKEFDFGGRDEPLVSQPYKDNLSGRADDMKSNYINQSVEKEFDFGGRDEPLVSQPYKDSLSGRAEDMKSNYINQSVEKEFDFGGRDEPLVSQPYTDRLNVPPQQSNINSVPLPSQPYMSVNPYMNPSAFNETLPQIIGYDPNGMPIYSQPPVTYSPPQIIGYDPNGMPIYAQSPVTYAPPQIIGYDTSGMPIYAQQPVLYQQSSVPQFQPVSEQLQKNTSGNNGVNEKFLDFIDDGKNKKDCRKSEEDFFGKSSGMGDVSAKGIDVGGLKKQESKKKNYMNETPLVDGDKLIPNDSTKFNKMYMRQTEKVSAENLEEKKTYGANHIMRVAKEVDVNRLNAKKSYKSYMTMSGAGEADPDTLESYTPKTAKSIMAEADHAVEAMPKKKPEYVDELDKIELPDYMKAKKTVRNDTPTLPELPEL